VDRCGRGEDDRIDVIGAERETGVTLASFLPAALEKAAIQQAERAVDAQFVHGAGDRLHRSPKGELHNDPSVTRSPLPGRSGFLEPIPAYLSYRVV